MNKRRTFITLFIAAIGLVVSCSKNNDPDPVIDPKTCNILAYNFLSPVASESGKVVYEVTATGDVSVAKILFYTTGSKKVDVKTIKLPFKDSANVNAKDSLALFVEGKAKNGKISAMFTFKGKSSVSTLTDECSSYTK